jgi:EpsD family peptidyl-prolyl cis-trans isomerase
MTYQTMRSSHSYPAAGLRLTVLTLTLTVACAFTLSACGGNKEKSSSQVAARVNKDEVTIHQINHALQAQRGVRPDQAETASSRILERLVDQQLAVQKAESLKVDRDPKVLQQLESSRSEIIARAYFDKIAEGVAKPTPEEVTGYYNENPALFRERRVYQLQEIALQAQPAQIEAIKRFVETGKPIDDLLIYLRSNGITYTTNQVMRAAEQVPLANLAPLSKLRDGQSMLIAANKGAQVVALVESRLQPIDEDRARPAIEQFMINDRKRRVVADDVKALRAAAKIEYVGKFAASAAGATDVAPTVADAAASAVRAVPNNPAAAAPAAASPAAPAATAAAAVVPVTPVVAPAPAAAASALSNNVINKGLGLK